MKFLNPKYIFFSIVLLSIGLSSLYAFKKYKNNASYFFDKAKYDAEISNIRLGLSKLSSSDIIEIRDLKDSWSAGIFLKVEKIDGDNLIFKKIGPQDGYTGSIVLLQNFYKENEESFPIVKMKLGDLKKAYTLNYDDSLGKQRKGMPLLNDGKKYEILEIASFFEPLYKVIESGSSTTNLPLLKDKKIFLTFENKGWASKIISAEKIEGGMEWNTNLPILVSTLDNSAFELTGINYTAGQKYKFKITAISDITNKKQVYLIEGTDHKKIIKRLQ